MPESLSSTSVTGSTPGSFECFSNYRISIGQARKECLIFGQGIEDHLQKIHGLKKYYSDPPGSFSKYLSENPEAGAFGLNLRGQDYSECLRGSF